LTCPCCSTKQTWVTVRFRGTFRCVECRETLRVTKSYATRAGYASFALAVVLVVLYGARGYWLVVLPFVVYFPIVAVVTTVMSHTFPPTLEIADEAQGC